MLYSEYFSTGNAIAASSTDTSSTVDAVATTSSIMTQVAANKKLKMDSPINQLRQDETLLSFASYDSDFDAFARLLHDGADPNIADKDGITLLHLLCFKVISWVSIENFENAVLPKVKLLLEYNANVNCQDDNGYTPLHFLSTYAAQPSRNVELPYKTLDSFFQLFLDHNANVNCQNISGETSLHLFVKRIDQRRFKRMIQSNQWDNFERHQSYFTLLLRHGANVNIPDAYGVTVLFSLTSQWCFNPDYPNDDTIHQKHDFLRLLLISNADVNIPLLRNYTLYFSKGDTTFHCAVRSGDLQIVKLILEYGQPDFSLRNARGDTPYDLAVRNNHTRIVECLALALQHQCHIFLRNQWIKINHHKTSKVIITNA
jgi:ankyrin repeat protein